MKTDVHFTTCHHMSVKCRPRTNDYNIEGFNITPWTAEEKLDIAKISLESLFEFADGVPVNVIDDGSNILEAVNWLLELDKRTNIFVRIYEHKGSSSGINNYFNNSLPKDTDLIVHFEDDHIYFNPENIDWKKVCYEFLKENPDVGVITFRSGLPSNPNYPDYRGAWGPIGFKDGKYPAILFNNMGNAHHIMLMETYKRFFPLYGNAGSCEAYMNGQLNNMGLLNAELQIPVYAFHSHCYSRALPETVTTDSLNMSPRGIEYGVKEIYEYIRAKLPIEYSYYKSKEEKVIKCYP